MIALHLSIYQNQLFLWTESDKIGDRQDLIDAVEVLDLDLKVKNCRLNHHQILLPIRGEVAVPSSPLIERQIDRRRKLALGYFKIIAKRIFLKDLDYLAIKAKNGNIPDTGILFGPSFKWMIRLMKIVLYTIRTEQFLPSIEEDVAEGAYYAKWIHSPDKLIDQTLRELAEHMPGTLYCVVHPKSKKPLKGPGQTAMDLYNFLLNKYLKENIKKTVPNKKDSLHDLWLAALPADPGIIEYEPHRDLAIFEKQLEKWRKKLELFRSSSFRIGLRLVEPEKPDTPFWKAEYFVQPKDDPSLTISVEEALQQGSAGHEYFKQKNENPVEFIFTSLGKLHELCPLLRAEETDHFLDKDLSSQEVVEILQKYASLLESIGIQLLLPAGIFVKNQPDRLSLKITAKSPSMRAKAGLSLETLAAFDYKLAIGDIELSDKELQTLASLKSPLVQIGKKWRYIDAWQISEAIKYLKNKKEEKLSYRDLLKYSMGTEQIGSEIDVSEVRSNGLFKELLTVLHQRDKMKLLAQPDGFQGTLRKYQAKGFSWLSHLQKYKLGACLADDMGLGKTIQALAFLLHEKKKGEKKPVLLVCPTTVINNWKNETERFTPDLKIYVHHGTNRKERKDFQKNIEQESLVITSYGLLQREAALLKKIKWSTIILDEAQNIKNPTTKQSKAARSLHADFRIALTGTPIENHVGDLWAIMDFLNPGYLGTQSSFKKTFHTPIHKYNDEEAEEKLRKLTEPFILRRLKTDAKIIADLPDKIETKQYCNLTKEQVSLYQAAVDALGQNITDSEGIERKGLILSSLVKLKQICNHPAHFTKDRQNLVERSGKLKRVTEIIAELKENKEHVLVFSQFTEMGEILKEYFQNHFGEEVFFLHGKLSRKKRDHMIDRFQNDPHAPSIFILSLKAGGTGITLTRANHVIHFDRWWNPAVENQATDRAFRIGQKKNVQVHKCIVSGTLEEKIDKIIERKEDVVNRIVKTGDKWLSEMNNEELLDLVSLNHEDEEGVL